MPIAENEITGAAEYKPAGFYQKYIKRLFDFSLSFIALVLLSPVFLILILIGVLAMKGNPFFTQRRPGKNEKIFRLIKFRTMTNEKDKDGNLLPDEKRLNGYGKFLRSTSLDEIPELINILKGDMSIVGPRPLLVEYLPLYNDFQHQRHLARPGLTGYAQAYGRNSLTWEEKFEKDVFYTFNITFGLDIRIIFQTCMAVLKHEGINSETSATMEPFTGTKEYTNV